MKKERMIIGAAVLALTAAIAVNGCSSGSSGGAVKTTSKGIISGFGSVIVNGVHYDGTAAGITIDGVSAAETDLKIGMEVTIKGSGTVASSIAAADSLEGPVTAVDAAAGTLVVLGQTVQTSNLTTFEQVANLGAVSAGMIVEVSGLADGAGVIHATRLELKNAAPAADTPIEVKGLVGHLDAGLTTFKVNALNVDYSAATLSDFPASGIADGQPVEVKGTFGSFNAGTSTLVAASVEFRRTLDAGAGEHVEIEGYVANYTSLSSFSVNGVAVNAGATGASGIADGVLIEVEGVMDANGVLIADEVKTEQESDIFLEGDATSVDKAGGLLSLLSGTVSVSATTEMIDSSAAAVRLFSIEDIAAGDHLEITGYQDAGGAVIATRVKRQDASPQAAIQGKVAAKTASTLTILGVTVVTDGTTAYRDRSSAAMAAADFFASVTVSTTVVKAQWDALDASGFAAPATQLELESTP